MREILFRGQTACGKKEWVYGGIWQTEENDKLTIIFQREPYEELPVYAETVGQYTGIRDKTGTRIFEGDIVKFGCDEDCDKTGPIEWYEDTASFAIIYKENDIANFDWLNGTDLEVIGNIHDNPELLDKE